MIINVIAWIVFGTLAGCLANLTNRSNISQDALDDIFVGIVGALIGGFTVSMVSGISLTAFNIGGLAIAGLGAVILLLIQRAVHRPHTSV